MTVFETKRLSVRELETKDQAFFIELLSAPEIIAPIPQPLWPMDEILSQFENFRNYAAPIAACEKVIWGVFEKDANELIGLCALLTNPDKEREIGYRFRQRYWGRGYGTELTRYMLRYCFTELKIDLLTADVNVTNIASVKILDRFFKPEREFYNERDKCTDRRYKLTKLEWETNRN